MDGWMDGLRGWGGDAERSHSLMENIHVNQLKDKFDLTEVCVNMIFLLLEEGLLGLCCSKSHNHPNTASPASSQRLL